MRINVEFNSMEEVEQFCTKFGTVVQVTNVVRAETPVAVAEQPTATEPVKKTRGRPKKEVVTPEVSTIDTTQEVGWPTTVEPQYEDVSDDTTPVVTVDELRAALIKLNDKIGMMPVREMIQPYAASCKAQDVPEDKRAELLAKVDEALSA